MRRRRGEVFLSHASSDRAFVERLAQTLHDRKIPYFYSERYIRGAQQWHDELGAALARCRWFALVLTPKAVASVWVKRELLFALQTNHYKDRILPLLVKTCASNKLSWTLAGFQHIDFRTRRQDATQKLLELLKTERSVRGR